MINTQGWPQRIRIVLYLLPTFFFLFLFTYYPAIRSFADSFFLERRGQLFFVGLDNYVRMFTDSVFWRVVRNNIFYSLAFVPLTTVIALGLALLLNRKLTGSTVYRTGFFYPMIIPYAAASMIWLYLLIPHYGVVNRFLVSIGLSSIEWVQDPDYAMWSIIMVGVWKQAGYFMMIFLAGLQQIPDSLIENADLEGATPFFKFRRIVLPMISPTVFFVLIISIIQSFQSVDQVYLMTRGGPGNATNLMVYHIYQHAFSFWNFNYASTLTVFLVASLLAVTVFFFLVIEKRVYYASED
jgi:sn-glycerol 3-phosphate transport system permease protein